MVMQFTTVGEIMQEMEISAGYSAAVRQQSLQRCIQSLEHACLCRDASCGFEFCLQMKRIGAHSKACKLKTNGGCAICKQFVSLVCYHAKTCPTEACPVPYCENIRQKLREQESQHRLYDEAMKRRRIARMNIQLGTD